MEGHTRACLVACILLFHVACSHSACFLPYFECMALKVALWLQEKLMAPQVIVLDFLFTFDSL